MLGWTPLTSKVVIGRHRIQVKAGGKEGEEVHGEEVVVSVNTRTEVKASLAGAASTTEPGEPADENAVPFLKRHRVWTWVATGAAVAALGVGIGLGVSAQSDYDGYQSTQDPAEGADLEESSSAKALGANICFGVAGAAAIGAVVLLFLEGRTESPASGDLTLAPMLGHNNGFSLSARF